MCSLAHVELPKGRQPDEYSDHQIALALAVSTVLQRYFNCPGLLLLEPPAHVRR